MKREVIGVANIGTPGLIIIIIVALVIFGPSKLPELGRTVGKTVREFRKATRGIMEDIDPKSTPTTPRKKTENHVSTTTPTMTADSPSNENSEAKDVTKE